MVIYLGGEYETRRGFSTGIVIDPPKLGGVSITDGRAWYFILLVAAAATLLLCLNLLRARTGRAWRAIRAHETVAEALGIGVASYKLLAFVISSAMTAVAGALFAYYRGFVSVEAFSLFLTIQYVAMVIIGGMGSLLGALLGAAFVTLFPYRHRSRPAAPCRAPSVTRAVLFAVNYAAFGVVDDPVPDARAAGAGRHLAPRPELLPAVAVQAAAGRGSAQMSLLGVDKLEVVYQRAITAVQGITLAVEPRQIVALLGTNGAGKTTTLRAISGFLGIDDARVTEGTIVFKGERIENRPPHEITRARRRAGARARQGVSQSDGRREPAVPVAARRRACRAAQREALVYQFFPALGELRAPHRRPAVRRRTADAGARQRARVPARAAAGRRALARLGAGGRGGPAAPPRRDPARARHHHLDRGAERRGGA